jgi:hypothetical protein
MTPPFPLCSEARHEAAIRSLLDGCVDFVRRRLSPERLVAVVLTGSFARGEGSVLSQAGHLKVLGDIEFFVVLARGDDYQRLRAEMATWGPRAAATLGVDRLRADLEFGPVHVGYLRRARPSIFVDDLRRHGKVLWGPPDLLETMPPFPIDAIPREDALRLLLNRTIEQIEAYDRLPTLAADALLDVAYQRLKIVLDLAGSALAFSGLHCASYAERPARLGGLIRETPSLARRLPPSFERDLAEATRLKLAPDDHGLASFSGDTTSAPHLRAQIVDAAPAMMGLLQWELERLLGLGGDPSAPSALDGLLDRYLASQSLARRAWEWTKLYANALPAPLPISAPAVARLFWRSTPRALIYAAGVRAYRALADPRTDPQPLERGLPLARAAWPDSPEGRRRAIVALWRWGVRNS